MTVHYLHPPYIEQNTLIFYAKIKPSSKHNSIETFDDLHLLKINLTAPPVDGKANKALVNLLSKTFHVPQSHVRIISGDTSKIKRIQIQLVHQEHLPTAFSPYILSVHDVKH